MTGRGKRILALALALAIPCLSGCWDSKEIDKLAVIVGSAVDLSEVPGMVVLTLEIANTQNDNAASPDQGQGGAGASAFSMLQATSETVMGCLMQLDQNSSRKTMPKHNQVRLFGSALCEQGLKDYIDMFMREQQTRLEVPMLVVEGNAGEALSSKVADEQLCGIFLAGMLADQARISPNYRVRMIDFTKTLLTGTTSAVIPLVKMFNKGEKQEINIIGMAVFKDDRMVGRLSNDDGLGYIWSLGKVKTSYVVLDDDAGRAVLHLAKLDAKRKVSLRPDGGVRVELELKGESIIGELHGFSEIKPMDLLPHLENLAEEKIKEKVMGTFEAAKALRADIFGFGASVYREHPKEWAAMKANWDALYQDIELSVDVELDLVSTGQIIQSLNMEETSK